MYMSYDKILKSINSLLVRAIGGNERHSEQVMPLKVVVHMNSSENDWNKAAIYLSEENLKIPSQRGAVVCYPAIAIREAPETTQMTTNEWNNMALIIKRQKEEKISNNIIQSTV